MYYEIFVLNSFWFWTLIIAEFIILTVLLEFELFNWALTSILALVLINFLGSNSNNLLQWISDNPINTVGCIIAYFAIGTVYVASPFIGKWWWFVRNIRDQNRDKKAQWLASYKDLIDNENNKIKQLNQDRVDYEKMTDKNSNYARILFNKIDPQKIAELQTKIEILEQSAGIMTPDLLPYWKEEEKKFYFRDVFGNEFSICKPEPSKFKAKIINWIIYWPVSLAWTIFNDPLRKVGQLIYEWIVELLKKISDSAWKDENS